MAHLASVGSHAINGVAALHSELLKSDVLRDFADLWPEKFSNKTNGVTPRRWVVLSNPRLAHCISQRIGEEWIRDLSQLRRLEPLADDADFRAEWRQIKHANKAALTSLIHDRTGVVVDPAAIFDVQVKRIHEYKRQHLNILHVIGLYHRLKTDPKFTMEPRVFVFGGKAAPGYHLAKLIIRLITAVAEIINRDRTVRDLIKVVYLPNFNVTNGQKIYPAADLSEQISTAGKEASGTGNMKFQMNGALTIGTVDGANIEICEEVGVENFFLFGLEAHEVAARRAAGYRPKEFIEQNEEIQAVLQLVRDGFFSRGNSAQFQPLIDNLVYHDPYFVLADYQSYADCQALVDQTYRDKETWTRMSILNAARSGKFSSDRTIREYCQDIWQVEPLKVALISQEEVKAGLVQ
jgi:starch phosphorylase